MAEAELADLVRRAHEGEVLGEALFTRLVALEAEAPRRVRLQAAALLEGQTRQAVERLAADLAVTVEDAPDQRRTGEQAAEALASMSWAERMGAIAQATGMYRELYEQLEAVVPDRGHPSMVALLAHERALNAFAAAEAEAEGSDAALEQLLGGLDDEHRAQVAALDG